MEQRAVQLVTSYIQKPDKERQLIFLPLMRKGFPGGSAGKEFACNVGDLGSIPGLGRSPVQWQPTPVFLFGEPTWTETLPATVHGVSKKDDEQLSTP